MSMGGPMDVTAELLQKNNPKKKKRYLLFLYNKHSSDADVKAVEQAVQVALKEHTVIRLEDPDEALRLILVKSIDLIAIDPEFIGSPQLTVEYVAEIKKRKKIPILFLTDKEEQLIKEYRTHLFLYDEMDDYYTIPIDYIDIGKRMQRMLQSTGRAAKRFNLGIPIAFMRIDTDKIINAILNDISLVGIGLTVENESLRRGAQLQLRIPLRRFSLFHPQYGDFLKIAVRVQRLSIDGKTLGCSFEFTTPMQQDCLQKMLEYVAQKRKQLQVAGKKADALAAHQKAMQKGNSVSM